MSDVHELVAAEYGIPEAASFLQGQTLEEVEASATALADLLGSAGQHKDDPQPLDPISAGLRSKNERKATVIAAITGRGTQPRDERGRYTGFDGGARTPVRRRDPLREHNQAVVEMARTSQMFARRSL